MSVKPAKIERTQRIFEIYPEDTEESLTACKMMM